MPLSSRFGPLIVPLIVACALLMENVDSTILVTAIPVLARDLGHSPVTLKLAVTSYVEGVRATNDWRIDSRADTLSAFISGLTRPEDDFTLTPAD